MIKDRSSSINEKKTINRIEYINKDLFIESFEDKIKQQRGDWEKDSEAQDAFDIAVKVINQM